MAFQNGWNRLDGRDGREECRRVQLGGVKVLVVFAQFAVTGGIACALILAILAFNRSPVGYSQQVRAIASAIAALGFAPSMVWPNEAPIIVSPAAIVIVLGLGNEIALKEALLYGALPWFITYVLTYEVWKRCGKRKPKAND